MTGTIEIGPACGHVGNPITVYPVGGGPICDTMSFGPRSLTAGPDGAMWFVNNGTNSIERITTAGVMTTYTGPGMSLLNANIISGSDGALWFTNETNTYFSNTACHGNFSIGRITTSGVVSYYTDPRLLFPSALTAGPDGALWFRNGGCGGVPRSIDRMTTSGVITNAYTNAVSAGGGTFTVGPGGVFWILDGRSVEEMTTSGVVTSTYLGPDIDGAAHLATGPDGALWFTDVVSHCTPVIIDGHKEGYCYDSAAIGRMTTSGVVTMYPYSAGTLSGPTDITAGPDGSLWFTNGGLKPSFSIGRITTSGVITPYTDPHVEQPSEIAAGSDGTVWFIDEANASIGRITTS